MRSEANQQLVFPLLSSLHFARSLTVLVDVFPPSLSAKGPHRGLYFARRELHRAKILCKIFGHVEGELGLAVDAKLNLHCLHHRLLAQLSQCGVAFVVVLAVQAEQGPDCREEVLGVFSVNAVREENVDEFLRNFC